MKLALFLPAILSLAGLARAEPRPARQFLIISDIHFNPLADPSLVPQLMAAEPAQWEAIFSGAPKQASQKYGDDSSWPLFSTLIAGIQKIQPRPKVIVLTGDVLPHKVQDKFAAALHSSSPASNAAAFRTFIRKTFVFIGLELEKGSGGIPVLYTLGNNDEECGDYALQPGGPFLQDIAGTVQTMAQLNDAGMSQWLATGGYSAANPLARHHRILAVNSNFWSRRYVNSCAGTADQGDPGQAELTWLSAHLKDAAAHGDKVWLVYHIPPGIDGHSSSKAGQVIPFFKPQYADAFNQLLDQYRKTIELNLAGHTHLDDIRLVKTEHTETLVLISPGVSPNVGQNPAYRLVTVDSKARPTEIHTYYLPELGATNWQLEYSTRTAYNLKKLDSASYLALYQSLETSDPLNNTQLNRTWRLYYSVSRLAGLSDSKSYLRSLYCASGNTSSEAFESCLTAVAK